MIWTIDDRPHYNLRGMPTHANLSLLAAYDQVPCSCNFFFAAAWVARSQVEGRIGGNDWRCPKRNLSRYTLQVSMGSSNASFVHLHDPHVGTRASNSPLSHSTPDWPIQG